MQIEIPDYMVKEIEKVNEKVTVYEDVEEFCREGIRRHLYDIISWIRDGNL
ncbi:MAG: hypothetical protein ACW990_00035 [Promethearchaeota archaeon]|jgi:hypothetical protein